jgi:hypothetical protein
VSKNHRGIEGGEALQISNNGGEKKLEEVTKERARKRLK